MADPQVADPVQVEDVDDGADDSAFEDDDQSSTTSIGSSILKHRQENGRTYHAYKEGKYVLPNDEGENDRLDLQHHMYSLTLDGKLLTAPIPETQTMHRVLDIGTGTGIWAIDYADDHPEAEVIGVDLSPIQPTMIPPNVSFYIDDIEEDWTYKRGFDLIFMRMMTGSIADWTKLFRQSYENLNPGGWMEVHDMKFPIEDNDTSFPKNCAVKQWTDFVIDAAKVMGRPLDSAKDYRQQMIDAGFENVTQVMYKWPQNGWPKDKKLKELGRWMFENFSGSLSGLSLALFTRGLGWSAEATEAFLVEVRASMKDTKVHGYYPIFVIYGQKPKASVSAAHEEVEIEVPEPEPEPEPVVADATTTTTTATTS